MTPPVPNVNPLPKPTTFLTDLLAGLSNLSKSHEPEATTPSTKSANLAKPYLLTLHALFPSTLLPALDLLDRHLVSRHVLSDQPETANDPSETFNAADSITAPEAPGGRENNEPGRPYTDTEISIDHVHQNAPPLPVTIPSNQATTHQAERSRGSTYYIKSSQWHQVGKSRHSGSYNSGFGGVLNFDRSYEVRPWAWSCTCAAFAFAAFNHEAEDEVGNGQHGNCNDETDDVFGEQMVVRETTRRDGDGGDAEHVEDAEGILGREEIEGRGWGGLMALHRDRGKGGGGVPICKHLLACVLAERWGEARDLVETKVMGKKEIAGWAAGWGG